MKIREVKSKEVKEFEPFEVVLTFESVQDVVDMHVRTTLTKEEVVKHTHLRTKAMNDFIKNNYDHEQLHDLLERHL